MVAALALGKCREKFGDAFTKVNRQTQDGAELNHDGKHLPVAVPEVNAEQSFGNAQVSGGTDRQEFSKSFDNAKQDSQDVSVQSSSAYRVI